MTSTTLNKKTNKAKKIIPFIIIYRWNIIYIICFQYRNLHIFSIVKYNSVIKIYFSGKKIMNLIMFW